MTGTVPVYLADGCLAGYVFQRAADAPIVLRCPGARGGAYYGDPPVPCPAGHTDVHIVEYAPPTPPAGEGKPWTSSLAP